MAPLSAASGLRMQDPAASLSECLFGSDGRSASLLCVGSPGCISLDSLASRAATASEDMPALRSGSTRAGRPGPGCAVNRPMFQEDESTPRSQGSSEAHASGMALPPSRHAREPGLASPPCEDTRDESPDPIWSGEQHADAPAEGLVSHVLEGVCLLGGFAASAPHKDTAKDALLATMAALDKLADRRWPATAGLMPLTRDVVPTS